MPQARSRRRPPRTVTNQGNDNDEEEKKGGDQPMSDQDSSSSSSEEVNYLDQRLSGSPNTIGNQHEVSQAEAEAEDGQAFQQISTTSTPPQLTVMQLRNRKKKTQQDLQTGFDGINLGNNLGNNDM